MAVKKVVIVGGVAGGASCAARLRRLDESAEIVMFERGPYISFANCGLPYYIGGVIEKRESLLVQTAESFGKRFRIDVRTNCEVISMDRRSRQVEARTADGAIVGEKYDYLVLSPGAAPLKPPIPGVESRQVFTLRSIPDADAISRLTDNSKGRKAVVVGGGYIGLEMAENLHRRGLRVAIVEQLPQVMPVFDPEMVAPVHDHLREKGVAVWLGDRVAAFSEVGDGIQVVLESGGRLTADVVVLSAGVRPDVRLAEEAGLEIGPAGGIAVDGRMQTSDKRIYAVGDAVEVRAVLTGKPGLFALAGPANRQGRIAADNICGRASQYAGAVGTAIVKVFDLAAAITGLSERAALAEGMNCEKVYLQPADHASYYPGASPLAIKALFASDNGRLLGAQIVGRKGVDKRTDVLATAIRAGMTVFELEDLELAYAPPYGAAKDPVNMVGLVASNVLRGDVEIAHWREVSVPSGASEAILDVRTKREWDRDHINGALHVPLDQLRDRLGELPREKKLLVYCATGLRSYFACRILSQKGFHAANMSGGWMALVASRPDIAGRWGDAFAQLKEEFLLNAAAGA